MLANPREPAHRRLGSLRGTFSPPVLPLAATTAQRRARCQRPQRGVHGHPAAVGAQRPRRGTGAAAPRTPARPAVWAWRAPANPDFAVGADMAALRERRSQPSWRGCGTTAQDLTPVTFLPPFPVASTHPCPAVRRLPHPSQQGAPAWSLGSSTQVARLSLLSIHCSS